MTGPPSPAPHRADAGAPDRAGPGALPIGTWSATWLAAQGHLKPTTRTRYEGVLHRHVLPRWSCVALDAVRHIDVACWVSDLTAAGAGPATVAYAYRVLCLLLESAVRDGRIPRNPARGVKLPKPAPAPRRYLSHAQVAALAGAAGEHRLVILTLAYCGLRWGELAALRVGSFDPARRRLEVARSVTEVRGSLVWGTPKAHQRRSVPVPDFLARELADHAAGRESAQLLFTSPRGAVLRNLNFRRDTFDRASAAVGLAGLTPHDLRHTAASLAISAGANVKAVQRMLGHASAAMTLDVYADLFERDLDQVAAELDARATRAASVAEDGRAADADRGQPRGGGPAPSQQARTDDR